LSVVEVEVDSTSVVVVVLGVWSTEQTLP